MLVDFRFYCCCIVQFISNNPYCAYSTEHAYFCIGPKRRKSLLRDTDGSIQRHNQCSKRRWHNNMCESFICYCECAKRRSDCASLTLSELTIGSSTGVIQVYTANSAAVGTHTVTVTATLASYATVSPATATFTIQISACIVTAFNMVALSD